MLQKMLQKTLLGVVWVISCPWGEYYKFQVSKADSKILPQYFINAKALIN